MGSFLVKGTDWESTFPTDSLYNPDYPRFGSYSIGGTQNATTAALAATHVNVVPYYPTWQVSRGTLQAKCQAVKALSTIGTKIFPYCILVDALDAWDTAPQANNEWYEILKTNQWFVYNNGLTHDTKVVGSQTGWSKPNYTQACPRVGGKTAAEWKREWDLKLVHTGGLFSDGVSTINVAACTLIDGVYDDNVFARERSAGDYNVDGVSETVASNVSAIQNAHSYNAAYWRSIAPAGSQMMANCADWPIWYPTSSGVTGTPLDQLYEGGVMENIDEWINGVRSSAASDLMRSIKVCQDAFRGSKLGILEIQTTSTAYSTLRLWHVISCLTGTYFYPHLTSGYLAQELGTINYDERGVLLGQPVVGAQGAIQWTPTYQAGSSGTGIYRRDFANGIVLWAAPGKTYTAQSLGGTFTRISGTLDPSVNTGASITSWTPNAGDSLVLLR